MIKPLALVQKLKSRDGQLAEQALSTANQVTVSPGGQTFPTIQAALNSIPTLSGPDYYSVYVGPGVYNEMVTLKPWVVVMGGEASLVTIQSSGFPAQASGVVVSAANSQLFGVTVICTGQSWGQYSTALQITDSPNFNVVGCEFRALDGGNAGINMAAVQVDLWANTQSTIQLVDCTLLAIAGSSQSVGVGLYMWNQANLTVENSSTISATGGLQNFGVVGSGQSTTLLSDSKIIGSTCALYLPNSVGNMTAKNCVIDGPVSPGVVVIGGGTPTGAAPGKKEGSSPVHVVQPK